MTRKDFILLADALKGARMQTLNDPQLIKVADYQHAHCVIAIADALSRDNPKFDRERFLRAADVRR